jgi:hypothetical protein
MYEVIPFEMLKTYVEWPQVIMKVGDLPAVCDKLTCDYKYLSVTAEITSFNFDSISKKLTIIGTGIPDGDLLSAEYGLQDC